MRIAAALLALAVAPGWTDAPDGRTARISEGGHDVTVTCSRAGGLRIEADAPGDLDTIILASTEASLHMRGRTQAGRFVSEMAIDGISVMMMRDDGSLRVGTGPGAYVMGWSGTAPVIDRLVRGCGAGS